MSDVHAWAVAVLDHLLQGRPLGAMPASLADTQAACFVTLHQKGSGQLRGCIGSLAPAQANLGQEICHNAEAAAFRDPRFLPVQAEEWPQLEVSVDVLSAPEPIARLGDLDPKRYGVIVSRGFAKGVLLPDLEGVETARDQVAIAKRKAGIPEGVDVTLERFQVTRYES